MKMRSTAMMRTAKIGYAAVSICLILAGLAGLLFPDQVLKLAGRFLGCALLAFGLVKLVGYFSRDLYRLAFEYDLQFGILLLILGLIILLQSMTALNLICIACGVCLIAECLFKLKVALEARAFGLSSWWLTAVLSVLTACVGNLLIFRASAAARTLLVLLASAAMASGILNLCVALTMVKIVRHQIPDRADRSDL